MINKMNKVSLALKSKTTWTVVAMFVIGGTNAISSFIPSSLEPVVMGALGLLAVYFKVTPSQKYD